MSVASCTRHAAAISRRIPTPSTCLTSGHSARCRSAIPWRSISSMSNESQQKVHNAGSGGGALANVPLDALREPGRGRPRSFRDNPKGRELSFRLNCLCPIRLTEYGTGETKTETLYQPDTVREFYLPGSLGCAGKCDAEYVRARPWAFLT